MMRFGFNNIGGGTVLRAFTWGDRRLNAGATLTGDEIRTIPMTNRQSLIDKRFIEVWPEPPAQSGERHIIHRGGGQFDVIAGVKLNSKPLSKDEAEDLATQPD